jgi:hypothetical protein
VDYFFAADDAPPDPVNRGSILQHLARIYHYYLHGFPGNLLDKPPLALADKRHAFVSYMIRILQTPSPV